MHLHSVAGEVKYCRITTIVVSFYRDRLRFIIDFENIMRKPTIIC